MRAAAPPESVTGALVWCKREESRTQYPDADRQRAFAVGFDGLTLPRTVARLDPVLGESGGIVWVRSFVVDESALQVWARLSPAGRLVGTLSIPADREVVGFANGRVSLRFRQAGAGFKIVVVYGIEQS